MLIKVHVPSLAAECLGIKISANNGMSKGAMGIIFRLG
jgi:hypothetical protein